ncbi:MAG: SET domain-containing protein [Proteobacteria bacterium]|nr:SET domain-containing protein [Pseudomonadota bacterium]
MMMVETELRSSPISGIGVFACEFVPKGTLIWKLDERFYLMVRKDDVPGFPALMQKHLARYCYPHMTRSDLICCEIDNGRFMNHSDDANTNFTDPELAWTTRDIQVGEEITCNYADFIAGFRGFDEHGNILTGLK